MNISEKSFTETLAFQVSSCRRALDEQTSLSYEDRRSICNSYIERLVGIRFVVMDFPKASAQVRKAIFEVESIRNQLADVGRSSTQSAEVVE